MTTTAHADVSADLELWAARLEAAATIARQLAPTAFVPDSLKVYDSHNGFDLDATTAQVAAALLTGQEIGLPPMASLRSIVVIHGTPALLALALRALVQSHGHDMWVVESTDTRAVVEGVRDGGSHIERAIWTMDRAAKLRLKSFRNPDGQWMRQPANMLVARASAEVARRIAAAEILGIPYVAEELDPDTGEPDEPLDAAAEDAPRSRSRTGRKSPRTRARPVAALPAPPVSPADNGQAAAPDESAAPGEVTMISPGQRTTMWAALRKIGITDADEAKATIGRWIETFPGRDGSPISTSNELTWDEAHEVIDKAKAEEARRAAQEAQDAAGEEPQEPPEDTPEDTPDE